MIKHRRTKLILLVGMILVTGLLWWVPQWFNADRNFKRLQELVGHNELIYEIVGDSSAYRRGPACEIYVLATEWDLRFYPNKYIIITKFHSGEVVVDLISGPGENATTTIRGDEALIYLRAMNLILLR